MRTRQEELTVNQKRGRAFIINVCKDSFYLAAMISLLWWLIPLYIAHNLEVEGFEKSLVFVISIFPLYFASLLIVLHHESKKMLKKQFEGAIYKSPLLVEEINRIDKNILENPALIFKAYSGMTLKHNDIPHLSDTEEGVIKTETQKILRKTWANKNKRKSFFYSLVKRGVIYSALASIVIYLLLSRIHGVPLAVTFAIMAFPTVMLIIVILKYWYADGPEYDYEL